MKGETDGACWDMSTGCWHEHTQRSGHRCEVVRRPGAGRLIQGQRQQQDGSAGCGLGSHEDVRGAVDARRKGGDAMFGGVIGARRLSRPASPRVKGPNGMIPVAFRVREWRSTMHRPHIFLVESHLVGTGKNCVYYFDRTSPI